jgi:trigger factor
MTFEKKDSSPCVVAFSVTVDANEVQPTYKKVLGTFLREVSVPGFRKGKVPMAVVKERFQGDIVKECAGACFREFYPKAVKEAGLDVVSLQDVEEMQFTPETGCSFTAKVEVKPAFDLPKYKKLSIKPGEVSVTDAQVDEHLESFRKAFAKFEDAKDGEAVGDGDFVQFDYSGFLDDGTKTPLSEVVPDLKAVCSAEGFWTQLEEGRFIPEILEALKGMKAGEMKDDVKVTFPQDNAPDALKGRACTYTVAVKSFRRRALPDDAAFVEAAKAESLDAMRAQFREQMEKDARAAELEGRRNQAIEQLLAKADFDVPPSLVQRQTHSYLEHLAMRAQYQGVSGDYIEKNRDRIIADAETNAARQVRLSYILLGIADAEKIEATDADVAAGLEKIAAGSNGRTTVEDLRRQLAEQNQTAIYREQVRAEKALDFVLAQAK